MLCVAKLEVFFGTKRILADVNVKVDRAEIVSLIGHNGAGKSTLLKAIFGVVPIQRGTIHFKNQSLQGKGPRELLEAGLVYAPQGNVVFPNLTVKENFLLRQDGFGLQGDTKKGFETAMSYFPALRGRMSQRAGTLSGGERQMLSIAMVLVAGPMLLLLDEPSLGLSPELTLMLLRKMREIANETGAGILIVEHKVRDVLDISDRTYVLRNGAVVYAGSSENLKDKDTFRKVYL